MPFDHTLVGKPSDVSVYTYSWREAALYALGVGAKKDELDYLYEGRGPKVLPSFAVVPKFPAMLGVLAKCGGDLAMVVHGGERVTAHKPFAPEGTLHSVSTIRAIYDMKRFAQMFIDTETREASGDLVAVTTSSILFRGEGGFGGEPPPKEPKVVDISKDRDPDFSIEEATSPEQALLYRLSGDPNPLHADPAFAERVGFPQGPILHGLCTYGHMVRHAVKGACGGDASRLQSFEGQFKKPVWPGQTLMTNGWIEGNKVALQVRMKETGEIVLGNAWALLNG